MALKARQCLATSLLARGLVAGIIAVASFGLSARQPLRQTESISRSELPAEAQATERLIRAGGPFPHFRDGALFANRERSLPWSVRGYYREYTVASPATRNRGARRMVCGGVQATEPDACFYSDDHYASFKRLAK